MQPLQSFCNDMNGDTHLGYMEIPIFVSPGVTRTRMHGLNAIYHPPSIKKLKDPANNSTPNPTPELRLELPAEIPVPSTQDPRTT
jgi:hypothetical protein